VSERLATLYRISRGECDLLIVSATSALYRLAPPSYLAAFTFFLRQGEKLDVEALRTQLALAGYSHVTQVVSPGEFGVRGGLIDLFPMGSALPYRIDLFDNEIESIKTFDVDTQRTLYPVRDVRLLPAREFPLDDTGRTRFRSRFREVFEGDPSKSALYKDVSNGITPGGIEYYLPLFFDDTATLADYLPPTAVIALHGDVRGAVEHFWRDTESRYRLLRGDKARPLLPPTELFLAPDAFNGAIKPFARVEIASGSGGPTSPLPPVQVDRRADDPLSALKRYVAQSPYRIAIVAESAGRRETMQQYFAEYDFHPHVVDGFAAVLSASERMLLVSAPIGAGFEWPEGEIAFVTETELYAGVVRRTAREAAKRSNVDAMVRDLSEVRIGDPVVHEEHGIGRYLGLLTLDLGDGANEFLQLVYANDAKLYVPVSNLHLISRYSGASPDAAPLHELGSGQWEKAKKKAAQQAHDTAAELLNLYAQRAARHGHTFSLKPHDYEAFTEGFGFAETPDQSAAIEAVIQDMTSGKAMDRLVCGDVGFGKTEVALRAAFVALADGKQVALLVPTTLLAEQHFQTFSDRFADFPVRIAELSRFRTAKETKAALEGLATGKIDLVIGTHKLLQGDVKFKDLGLVIIDEEHRFGVRQKELLKRLRAEVDVLTLTATPIPRTLAMSLEGIRDFSVIATAPERRLAIKTFVAAYSPGIVREAALRELKRGGQIYFLHNEVDTIATRAEALAKLLPEARIAVAHGQMAERELEHVMRDFYQQRVNLLLCSTIIETGIDVPTANTIVIDRADKFGLAQLHQLRGRVGRSHHQAYAYLLTPPWDALSAQAKKRLEAIQMMEDLGSGFYLAMHDLEIRGAGEVLGEEQSGEMQEVGFQLYNDMLRSSVSALKAGREPDLTEPLGVTTEINLHVPALLPERYCNDVHERLVLYKRLASVESTEELDAIQEELVDRFGPTPEQAQALLASHRLRLLARPLGVRKVDAGPERTTIQFVKHPPFDAGSLILLVQKDGRIRFAGPDRIRIERAAPALSERIALVRDFLARLR
jgi:transcription-repair coupling factor (superfamily II helicase)